MRNFIVLLVLSIIIFFELSGQVSGGIMAGQQAPRPAEVATIGTGPVSGDVDLFNGTLNASYDFGAIQTLSGLSYPIRLVYNSAQFLAFDPEQNSGIPYGEGWTLANASITVETDAFDFVAGDLQKTPFNGSQVNSYSTSEAAEVGKRFFSNPYLNLPGGVSGRLVYKFPKNINTPVQPAVYLLEGFSSYIEASFDGHQWVVKLDDGTEYVFYTAQKTVRNPVSHSAQMQSDAQFAATALPKQDVLKWHLSEIRNPNHSLNQRIILEHVGFGKIDRFPVFSQASVAKYIDTASSYVPNEFQVYKDVFLSSIYSADDFGMEYQRVEFKHRSWKPEKELAAFPKKMSDGKFLLLSDNHVVRIDSMYSKKTVWFTGKDLSFVPKDRPALPSNQFDYKWRRYMHLAAHQNPLSNYISNIKGDDPYAGYFKGIPLSSGALLPPQQAFRAHQKALGQSDYSIPFTHSVIESGRISNLENMPSGDLYEVKTTIRYPDFADMNFDVALVTGQFPGNLNSYSKNVDGTQFEFESALSMPASPGLPTVAAYDKKGHRIYDSFSSMVKWNPAYAGSGWTFNKHLLTTNVFRMPNLPNSFEGFHIQVGPAADDVDHGADGDMASAYPFFYTNKTNTGKPGGLIKNSITTRTSTWFGSGAPAFGVFANGRLGMGKQANWSRGTHSGSTFHLFHHFPVVNPFRPHSMLLQDLITNGPNQPTSVTRERVDFGGFNPTNSVLYQTHLAAAHKPEEDAELINVELVRISKNPYLLDSVVFFVRNGNFDSTGRVRVAAFKLDYELEQTRVLNNVSPGYVDPPAVVPQDIWKKVNGKYQYRNVWKLATIRRVGVDTIGRVAINSPQSYTRYRYMAEDLATPFIVEGNLLSEIWNELGGRTKFEYDLNLVDTIQLGFSGPPASADLSSKVTAGGILEQQRFAVVKRSEESENGWLETDYSYGNRVVLDLGIKKDKHFNNQFNRDHGRNYVWGYDSIKVEKPALGNGARGKTVFRFHHKKNSFSDSLLFGRVHTTRTFDESDQLVGEEQTNYKIEKAYRSGWYYKHKQTTINGFDAIADGGGGFVKGAASAFNYPLQRNRFDSWFITANQTISKSLDPGTGLQIVDTLSRTYYDWDTLLGDPEGDYDAFYKAIGGGNFFKTDLQGNAYSYHPGGLKDFDYPHEPSWQLASLTRTSPDMPCYYQRQDYYYLWDAAPLLHVYNSQFQASSYDSIVDFENSFRPYHFAKKYGIRSLPIETRKSTYDGNQFGSRMSKSTYFWYDVFDNVDGEFSFTVDSTNWPGPLTWYQKPENSTSIPKGEPQDSLEAQRPNMVDLLGRNFYLRAIYSQVDSNRYFDADLVRQNYHNVLRPAIDKFANYERQLQFDPVWPVVENYFAVERNMYGQITKETDLRQVAHKYEFEKGEWHTSWDSTGKVQYSVRMKTPGLVTKMTMSADAKLQHEFAYEYERNGLLSQTIELSSDTVTVEYDDHSRLSRKYHRDHKVIDIAYGQWSGGLSQTFAQRTASNFIGQFNFDGIHFGNPLITMKFTNPLGTIVQSYAAIKEGGMFRRRYAGEVKMDSWQRPVQTHMPTSKLTANYSSYDPYLPVSDYTERKFEGDLRNRVLRSAQPTRNIQGGRVAKSSFNIIDLDDFQKETGVSNKDILANYSCLGISNTGPTVANVNSGVLNPNPGGGNTGPVLGYNNGGQVIGGDSSSSSDPSWTNSGGNQVNQNLILSMVRLHRTEFEDEDGKKSIQYQNAFGQKLADLAYDDSSHTIQSRVLTLYVYDVAGNLQRTVHPNKLVTKSKHNFQGRPYEVETPDAGVTKYVYTVGGDVKVKEDENLRQKGSVLLNFYDKLGRLFEVRRDSIISIQNGIKSPMHFETNQQKTFFSSHTIWDIDKPLRQNGSTKRKDINNTLTFPVWTYNEVKPIRRMSRRHDFGKDMATTIWWAPDFPINEVHPGLKHLAENQKNIKGKVSVEIFYNESGLPDEFTFYRYDRYGHLSNVGKQFNRSGITGSDEGFASIIHYDDLDYAGNPSTLNIDLDADSTLDLQHHYQYEANGQLKEIYFNRRDLKSMGTKVATLQHDPSSGRIKRRINYGISPCLTSIPIDTIEFDYDQLNRLIGSYSHTFDFDLFYDNEDVNQLTAQNYPGSAVNHDEAWNGLITSSYCQYKLDSVPGFQRPTVYGYAYDGLNRLITADASVLENQLQINLNGNGLNPNPVFGKPVLASNNAYMGDVHYRFDKAGNFTGLLRYHYAVSSQGEKLIKGDNWIYQYYPNTNRLIKLSTQGQPKIDFSYDLNGNLKSDSKRGNWGFEYNSANLPLRFVNGTGSEVKYTYGLEDRRVFKEEVRTSTDTAQVYYLRDESGKVLATLDSEKGGWVIPIYGEGMIAEAFISDSTSIGSFSNKPFTEGQQQKLKRRTRRKNILKLVKNFTIALAPAIAGAYSPRLEGKERIAAPIVLALSPILMHYSDKLVDAIFKKGDFLLGMPEAGLAQDSTQDSLVGGLKFYILDQLGNTRVTYRPIFDQNATTGKCQPRLKIIAAIDYYPYGKHLRSWFMEEEERWQTSGNERDVESGLDWRGARAYDAEYARFIQIDPMQGDFADWTPYNYVFANPASLSDPQGRCPMCPLFVIWDYAMRKPEVRTAKTWVSENMRVESVPYAEGGSMLDHSLTFLQNTVGKIWNNTVPTAFEGVLTPPTELAQNNAATVVAAGQWMLNQFAMSDEERIAYWKDVAANPESYEDLVSMLPAIFLAKGAKGGPKNSRAAAVAENAANRDVLPMKIELILNQGAKIDWIVNEIKALTYLTGNEHAVVRLANGKKAIVSGGSQGIYFDPGQIKTLFGHTHPTVAGVSSSDFLAIFRLEQSKQYIFHGGLKTVVRNQ